MNDQTPINASGTGPFEPRRDMAIAAETPVSLPAVSAEMAARRAIDTGDIIRLLVKWRWVIGGLVGAALLAAVVITLAMTPRYRATVRLEINDEPTQVVQVGNVQPGRSDDAEYMATQYGLLQSRSLAERVARQLNLASRSALVDQALPRATREKIVVGKLARSFRVAPVRSSRLVDISFTDPDPALAQQVANTFAEGFIAGNLERRFEATAYARDFLQNRIALVKGRLEQSERDLVAYARREGIVSITTQGEKGTVSDGAAGSLTSATLVELNQALTNAQSDRIQIEEKYRQSRAAGVNAEILNSPTVQALTGTLTELQAQYDDNLNVYKPEFPSMVRLKTRIDTIKRSIAAQTRDVGTVMRSDYQTALARERVLAARVAQLKGSVLDLRGRSIQYNIIQREVDTNRTLYDGLLQRYKEIGVAGGVGENLVSIVDRAQLPSSPYRPNLFLNLAIGLLAGLILSALAVFVIEFIDDTIATPNDVETKLGLVPLGAIPRIGRNDRLVDQLADPRSPIAEAYQSVRSSLQFSTAHGTPASILITSSVAAEGKSSTSLALAQTFARLGKTVLLIDADLRKPTFRISGSGEAGLSNLLVGDGETQAAIRKVAADNLYLLPSGAIPPNPAELLAGKRLPSLMSELSGMFDVIVIDGPPVLGLADAPLLSAVAEVTLVVVSAGTIRRQIAVNAVTRLRASKGRLIGAILTKVSKRHSGYGYGYGYGENSYAYGDGKADAQRMIEVAA